MSGKPSSPHRNTACFGTRAQRDPGLGSIISSIQNKVTLSAGVANSRFTLHNPNLTAAVGKDTSMCLELSFLELGAFFVLL